MSWLLVFLGGGAGCMARYGVSLAALRFWGGSFPMGTLISNALSCMVLVAIALLATRAPESHRWVRYAVVIGFCGGFSTFSTFSHETVALMKNGNLSVAVLNIAVNLAVCLSIVYRLGR